MDKRGYFLGVFQHLRGFSYNTDYLGYAADFIPDDSKKSWGVIEITAQGKVSG